LLPDRLLRAQGLFKQTGGLHAQGKPLGIRDDVGRYNPVDERLGAEFLAARALLRNTLLLMSDRASFEL
jgi:FdhD protein